MNITLTIIVAAIVILITTLAVVTIFGSPYKQTWHERECVEWKKIKILNYTWEQDIHGNWIGTQHDGYKKIIEPQEHCSNYWKWIDYKGNLLMSYDECIERFCLKQQKVRVLS